MARQQARRRNRERLTGIVLACLGVVVLVVAVIALSSPGSNGQAAASRSASSTPSTASTASTLPAQASSSGSSSRPAPSTSSSRSPSDTASAPNTDSSTGVRSVPIVVLNNTRTNGLATDAAKQFRDGGWTVSRIGNLTNDIVSTCAYYDPDVDGAEDAAKALRDQYPAIKRVVEKFPELPGGAVVVVLTSDYSAG